MEKIKLALEEIRGIEFLSEAEIKGEGVRLKFSYGCFWRKADIRKNNEVC